MLLLFSNYLSKAANRDLESETFLEDEAFDFTMQLFLLQECCNEILNKKDLTQAVLGLFDHLSPEQQSRRIVKSQQPDMDP